jgi:hypothetical protein
MKLNQFERAILLGVVADIAEYTSPEFVASCLPYPRNTADISRRCAMREARSQYVRLNLRKWLGRALSPSDSTQASRAYKRLEALGLVELVREWGSYVTHLALTPAGAAFFGEKETVSSSCSLPDRLPAAERPEEPKTQGGGTNG